jgi:ABC-type antimicrobial peptide transport system permease subunit
MTADVLHLIAFAGWIVMLAFAVVMLGVVIAGIVEKLVEDIL